MKANNNTELLVSFELNKTGANNIKVDRISSVYTKNRLANYLKQQDNLGNRIDAYDKEKTTQWLKHTGLQLPKVQNQNGLLSTGNIIEQKENVNSSNRK